MKRMSSSPALWLRWRCVGGRWLSTCAAGAASTGSRGSMKDVERHPWSMKNGWERTKTCGQLRKFHDHSRWHRQNIFQLHVTNCLYHSIVLGIDGTSSCPKGFTPLIPK